MAGGGLRWRLPRMRVPITPRLRPALAAAPFAVSLALMCDLALAAASIGFAQKAMAIAVVPIAMASVITFVVAIAVRSERAFLASVLTLAGACAVADLPVHRNGAAVFASVAGAAVLVFVEAGGAALEPRGAGTRVGRPATTQAVWVGLVAVGGASAGWLLLSLQPEVSDLGLAALGIGVLAAVCLIALAAMLAAAAIADRKHT